MLGAAGPATGITGARRYRSPRREQQARRTRARITAAAARQFLARGYAAATMRAVAADAGVALPTVELVFGTKARLLARRAAAPGPAARSSAAAAG